jgi:hypothetical protein
MWQVCNIWGRMCEDSGGGRAVYKGWLVSDTWYSSWFHGSKWLMPPLPVLVGGHGERHWHLRMRYADAGGLRASRMAVPPANTTQLVAIRRAARSAMFWLIPRNSGHAPGLRLGEWELGERWLQ